jgi:hypothetical protein
MAMTQMPDSQEEIASRGDELYERHVRTHEDPKNRGKIAAIDIQTGEYEVADKELTAVDRLRARCPGALIWFVRIGHRAVHRFGGRPLSSRPELLAR